MTQTEEDHIKFLIKQAANSPDSGDAMRYSQAAVNAANAIYTLNELKSKQT